MTMGIGNALYRLSKKFSRVHLYEWLDHEIAKLGAAARPLQILNVGSGGDVYERVRTLANATIIQADIDPARKPDVVASVCDMPMFENGRFDAVFMMEVLEHVTEPHLAVKELRRVLKPGGLLVLSTPFIFPLHDEPHDYYRYTKYGLAFMLREFVDVEIRPRNDYLHAIMVLFARLAVTNHKRDRLFGMMLFCFALLLYPFVWLLSRFCLPGKATTGYFTTARGP